MGGLFVVEAVSVVLNESVVEFEVGLFLPFGVNIMSAAAITTTPTAARSIGFTLLLLLFVCFLFDIINSSLLFFIICFNGKMGCCFLRYLLPNRSSHRRLHIYHT